ncbi:hypothetical protein [Streptomyces adonidis]|uniref:hypothetical protein n=1 Tax=Streptomyces adonidis TaxID=3231367 RepID=UPI0034DAF952
MSSGHRTMTLFVTVILGLIFVILGLSAGWPLWAWPTVATLLLLITAVTHRVLAPRPAAFPQDPFPGSDRPLPEPREQEQRISYVALPSSVRDYDFSFSATVRWLVLDVPEGAPYVNPAGLAVDAVLERARVATSQQPPHRSAVTQHQLDGALATMRIDPTGRVMAMAQDVELSLPEHDRERLSKLSNVRKDEDVWEHERNYERSKRAYLGDDVLKDTGSAVVWWLSRNEAEVEGAVDRIGLLAQLSAAANNESIAPPFQPLVASAAAFVNGGPDPDHEPPPDWLPPYRTDGSASGNGSQPYLSFDSFLEWFGFSADDPDLDLFAQRLANVARAHGKTEVVDKLRHRFGPEQTDEDPEDEDTEPN